ncbi:MAG: hypothetical protein ACK55E_14995 [Cyanobacteriota bacterium]|jgi:hypothetical protein
MPMRAFLRMLLVPLQAPMLLLLVVVSTYQGLHWAHSLQQTPGSMGGYTEVIWSIECMQALVVVVVCTMPLELLHQLSSMMSASRVVSLVLTLLMVTIGGLYLLHLAVLASVLVLASAVMLARLDLVRIRVVPPPLLMTVVLSIVVLGGLSLGRLLSTSFRLTPFGHGG